jgi:hypothetical protein
MFKIQNMASGSLIVDLEAGSIILQPGKYYDLDGVCSRKWINSNSSLRRMLAAKHIRVVHDSESFFIPKQPIKSAFPANEVTAAISEPVSDEKPVIIDLSQFEPEEDVEAVESDDDVEDDSEEEVEDGSEEEVEDDSKDEVEYGSEEQLEISEDTDKSEVLEEKAEEVSKQEEPEEPKEESDEEKEVKCFLESNEAILDQLCSSLPEPFICKFCGLQFKTFTGLNKHAVAQHSPRKKIVKKVN